MHDTATVITPAVDEGYAALQQPADYLTESRHFLRNDWRWYLPVVVILSIVMIWIWRGLDALSFLD